MSNYYLLFIYNYLQLFFSVESEMSKNLGRAASVTSWPAVGHVSPLLAPLGHSTDNGSNGLQQAQRPALAHCRRQQFPIREFHLS